MKQASKREEDDIFVFPNTCLGKQSHGQTRPYNHISVKYSLAVLGGGAVKPCLCFDLIVGYFFLLKHYVFLMIKAVSNRGICFIKALLS